MSLCLQTIFAWSAIISLHGLRIRQLVKTLKRVDYVLIINVVEVVKVLLQKQMILWNSLNRLKQTVLHIQLVAKLSRYGETHGRSSFAYAYLHEPVLCAD